MSIKKTAQRPKVAIVSALAYAVDEKQAKQAVGGSETQSAILADALGEHTDTYLVTASSDGRARHKKNYTLLEGFSLSGIKKFFFPFALHKTLRKLNPDVIIQRAAGIETYICARYAKKYGKQFIYSTASTIDTDGTFTKKGIVGKLYAKALRMTPAIAYQSQEQLDMHKKSGNLPVNSAVIPNMFVLPPVSKQKKSYVLWVGRADKLKNPESYIRLAQSLPDTKFVMVMQKTTDDARWEMLMEMLKVTPNIDFTERIPFSQIQAVFDKSILLVNTSDFEGFPNVFLQSCIAASPICSLVVNPNHFLDEYKCGVSCQGDEQKLHKEVQTLLNNTKKLQTYSKNARKYVEKNHDAHKLVSKWQELF